MFGPIRPTPYDLRFSISGIPVNVTPMFWAITAIMGLGRIEQTGLPGVVIWVVVVFFSILLHELGHAIAQRAYGQSPQIILYHFGGVAQYMPRGRIGWTQQIVISLAGPGIQLAFYGVLQYVVWQLRQSDNYPEFLSPAWLLIYDLEYVNLYWALVNLLPVLPLDGGRVAETLLVRFRHRDGADLAIKIGIVVGGAAALWFFMNDYRYAGFLFVFLAFNNYQSLQNTNYRGW
ncbi:site-2 protease family protein [Stratiformator vulcanicus]|uniref:Peptidase family M50 n=1 Tax=Stratiformator vulcanicus TaxID=2527980 RepID=A0A517R2P1_9PLAN|nr:site-2 protease family protein [Stratiformator vulcanicus]QDT38113.1 Peptidase family M50 [Stratiformator vulcanicus]